LILFAFGNKHIADWTIEYSYYVTSDAAVIVLPCVANLFTDQCFQAIYCGRHVVLLKSAYIDVMFFRNLKEFLGKLQFLHFSPEQSHQIGWLSGNALDFNCGGARYESRPDTGSPEFFWDIFGPSRQIPGYYRNQWVLAGLSPGI
jgi:hypothetical protein